MHIEMSHNFDLVQNMWYFTLYATSILLKTHTGFQVYVYVQLPVFWDICNRGRKIHGSPCTLEATLRQCGGRPYNMHLTINVNNLGSHQAQVDTVVHHFIKYLQQLTYLLLPALARGIASGKCTIYLENLMVFIPDSLASNWVYLILIEFEFDSVVAH